MPLPERKKGESTDDFISRCMSNGTMKKEFPDQEQRLAVCHEQARKQSNMERRFFSYRAQIGDKRVETFKGEDHLVFPTVMLVEGVMQAVNAPEPELVLAEEFGKVPSGWNGRPVLVNHPVRSGELVSANRKDVLEEEKIGFLLNTHLKDKKLVSEVWVNLRDAQNIGGKTLDTVEKIQSGEITEVSTGLFADAVPESGEWEGRSFSAVQKNIVPDHLALLEEGLKGACSVEDGCGANRANQACDCGNDPCTCKEEQTEPSFKERFQGFISRWFKPTEEMSASDLERALGSVLSDSQVVVEVFAGKGKFIYVDFEEDFGATFSRSFSIADDGAVSLGDDIERVRAEVDFVPVRTNQEENGMSKEKIVDALISNGAFTEDNRDWLLGLEEGNLETIQKAVEKEAEEPEPEEPEDDDLPAAATEEQAITEEQYLQSAPKSIRDTLERALQSHREEEDKMVQAILKDNSNTFTEDELRSFGFDKLQKIHKFAKVEADYSLTNGSGARANASADAIPAMPTLGYGPKQEGAE